MNDDIHICRMEITPAKAMEYLQQRLSHHGRPHILDH